MDNEGLKQFLSRSSYFVKINVDNASESSTQYQLASDLSQCCTEQFELIKQLADFQFISVSLQHVVIQLNRLSFKQRAILEALKDSGFGLVSYPRGNKNP